MLHVDHAMTTALLAKWADPKEESQANFWAQKEVHNGMALSLGVGLLHLTCLGGVVAHQDENPRESEERRANAWCTNRSHGRRV